MTLKYLRNLSIFLFLITNLHSSEIQYLHPLPGSTRLSVNTTIIVRFRDMTPDMIKNVPSFITVQTESGMIVTGKTKIASDNRTFNFQPDAPYPAGEKITVSIYPDLKDLLNTYCDTVFHFTTLDKRSLVSNLTMSQSDESQLKPEYNTLPPVTESSGTFKTPHVFSNGVSVPSDFPFVDVTINNNPYDGNIFIDATDAASYLMVLDPSGIPLWYKRSEKTTYFNPNIQPNGLFTFLDNWHRFSSLNKNFGSAGSYRVNSTDGYDTDQHELLVQPNGNYLIIGKRKTTVDMSLYVAGGKTDAIVEETIIQELTPSRDILIEWRAWDHFDILDLNVPLTGSLIEFTHMNGLDIDSDGHILLSSRHTNEITKINRSTGEIIWRLGGKKNQFNFVNDPLNGFSRQHNIQSLGGGRYTLFDNGNTHTPHVSRAVEYAINTSAMTATLVWQFRDTPDKYSFAMGNVQRLPNDNTLINWAMYGSPKLTEVTPSGTKVFEMDFHISKRCYRVYKYNWQGIAAKPYLVAEPKLNYITLIFNKFGDVNVAKYNIYGGLYSGDNQFITTSTQPFAHLKSELTESGEYFFRVKAVMNNGSMSDYSNEVSIFHRIIEPGENMVINGDFSNGFYFWDWYVDRAANTKREITPDSVFHYNITYGGTTEWHVACRQQYIRLLQGETYRLEFDAWAAAGRSFEAEIRKNIDPFTNFSKIGIIWLTPQKTHYAFEFVMEEPDESDARLCLNAGMSSHDVYIDNISVIQVPDDSIPTANFEASPIQGTPPLEVQFTDLSTDTVFSWAWDFGDGETSTGQHPLHIYQIADTFDVTLVVTGFGGADTLTKAHYIQILEPPPIADLTTDTTQGCYPLHIQFSDLSTGSVTSWMWDFGDGQTSMEQNPLHIYQTADTFDVTLIITGSGGADTLTKLQYIWVWDPPPTANFEADTTRGLFPLDIQFTDLSSGPVNTWFWNFGDGETSTLQNPQHTYSTIDSFTVTLKVTGPGGMDTLIHKDYIITSGLKPTAGFNADTTRGHIPFEVQFTDESIGVVNTWAWDFGDGENSNLQHPAHTYEATDTFSVRLIVTGPNGADTLVQPDYIKTTEQPPNAIFSADTTTGLPPLQVRFVDSSTGKITSWHWDFGDSTTSKERHPVHTYLTADTLTVSLIVAGPGGVDLGIKNAYIIVIEPPPRADFIADTTKGIIPFEIHFTDQSTGEINLWYWDFGDGRTSMEQNPTHVYEAADSFSVSLIVSGNAGDDIETKANYIVVMTPLNVDKIPGPIPAHFTLAQNYPNPFNASTKIDYTVPEKSHVLLSVYNIRGECVCELVNEQHNPGTYQSHFDTYQIGSGLYFYRMDTSSLVSKERYSNTKKMIILR